jgi:anti-sigma28 factor (negative regulator of flagellin synthesis)
MKIQGSNGPSQPVEATTSITPGVKAGQSSSPSSAGSASTDQIQLSNLAQFAAASDESPNNIAKLSSLSATVSSGRYQVDAVVVSNSIIESSLQLSGRNFA